LQADRRPAMDSRGEAAVKDALARASQAAAAAAARRKQAQQALEAAQAFVKSSSAELLSHAEQTRRLRAVRSAHGGKITEEALRQLAPPPAVQTAADDLRGAFAGAVARASADAAATSDERGITSSISHQQWLSRRDVTEDESAAAVARHAVATVEQLAGFHPEQLVLYRDAIKEAQHMAQRREGPSSQQSKPSSAVEQRSASASAPAPQTDGVGSWGYHGLDDHHRQALALASKYKTPGGTAARRVGAAASAEKPSKQLPSMLTYYAGPGATVSSMPASATRRHSQDSATAASIVANPMHGGSVVGAPARDGSVGSAATARKSESRPSIAGVLSGIKDLSSRFSRPRQPAPAAAHVSNTDQRMHGLEAYNSGATAAAMYRRRRSIVPR
jgi:hypothetical protein